MRIPTDKQLWLLLKRITAGEKLLEEARRHFILTAAHEAVFAALEEAAEKRETLKQT